MKKPLEVWHLVFAAILVLMSVGGVIITQSNKIQSQQDTITFLLENKAEQHQVNSETNIYLKEMNNKMTEILVELQNKQDKAK